MKTALLLIAEAGHVCSSSKHVCVCVCVYMPSKRLSTHFTRSARLNVCNGLLASLAISFSAMVVELGGCDHFWAEGDG